MDAWGVFAAGVLRRLGGSAVVALAVCAASAALAEPQTYSLYDFQFEDGTIMSDVRIAYDARGTLAPSRDNAIVLLHDAIGDRRAFEPLIGPGKLFDTDRYFVVTADAIGGGDSSSPGEGNGQDFPRYTIRDMMAAVHGLAARGLGLTKVRAVVGRAMGAQIGLEWAIHYPEMVRSLVLLAPAARSDANYRVVIDLMLSAIAGDPDWAGGRYERNPVEGLRRAGMIYYPWSVSAAYLDRLTANAVAQESEAAAKRFAAWDANALALRLAAARGHDVAAPFAGDIDAALAHATMPVLLMPSAGDRLIDPINADELRDKLPHATYAEIPGVLGDTAIDAVPGSEAGDFIAKAIGGFLR